MTELTFSRNATEALQALIGQYNKAGAGDTIMYADLDYNAMQWAMNGLAARRGATVAKLAIPEPASHDAIISAYKTALDAHPKTKLLLLTHCNNKTGLLLPVKDIVALARPRGIDVVVDAAHSFGQVPLKMADLDAEFVGLNLHKWIGAPIGAGAMYIREDTLGSIDLAHADESAPPTSIDSRIHTGTTNFATITTVPEALAFQESIGIDNKAARLRYLRDRWVRAVRGVKGVDVLTPDDPNSTARSPASGSTAAATRQQSTTGQHSLRRVRHFHVCANRHRQRRLRARDTGALQQRRRRGQTRRRDHEDRRPRLYCGRRAGLRFLP